MADMKTQADFDPAQAEAFAERFLMALNNRALCLMVSVGHRTGLFDVLRTLPPATSYEIATRALRDNGLYLMQDIKGSSHLHHNMAHPLGTLLYTVSCMHCMTVSLAQGGEGLGAMWGEEKTREYLQDAGFRSIETHQLAHDIQNNWYVVRK